MAHCCIRARRRDGKGTRGSGLVAHTARRHPRARQVSYSAHPYRGQPLGRAIRGSKWLRAVRFPSRDDVYMRPTRGEGCPLPQAWAVSQSVLLMYRPTRSTRFSCGSLGFRQVYHQHATSPAGGRRAHTIDAGAAAASVPKKAHSIHSYIPTLATMADLSTAQFLLYKIIGFDVLHVRHCVFVFLLAKHPAPHRPPPPSTPSEVMLVLPETDCHLPLAHTGVHNNFWTWG